MSTTKKARGRGFLHFKSITERAAFGAYMKDVYEAHGGRNAVADLTGVARDTLGKYSGGRAIPSQSSLEKLIEAGVLPFNTPEDFAAAEPWKAADYRRAEREELDKQAVRMDNYKPAPEPAPAPNEEVAPANLMDAVMAEPGLNPKQRAKLAALIAMIVNGVDINISVSVKR